MGEGVEWRKGAGRRDLEERGCKEGRTGKERRCGVGAETLEMVRVDGEGVKGRKRLEGWSCREVGK